MIRHRVKGEEDECSQEHFNFEGCEDNPKHVAERRVEFCVCSLGDSSMLWRECILSHRCGQVKGRGMTLDFVEPDNTGLAKEMTGQRRLRKFTRQREGGVNVLSHGKRGDSIKGDAMLPDTVRSQKYLLRLASERPLVT